MATRPTAINVCYLRCSLAHLDPLADHAQSRSAFSCPGRSLMATLARLCLFAREHETQARTNCDELRAEQWNDVLDLLLDRRFGMITAG